MNQPGYLYILVLQNDGALKLLYPNEDETENFIESKEVSVPGESKEYEFFTGEEYGTDSIIAILSRNRIKKLHKKKYYTKPVYQDVSVQETAWLKKLTKKLSPDQWVSSEVKVFISPDSTVQESVQKTPKAKVNQTPPPAKLVKKEEKPKEDASNNVKTDLYPNEVMRSFFKLPEPARIKGNKKGILSVYKEGNKFKLILTPYIANPSDSCEYSISVITEPKKNSNVYGNIHVNPAPCILKEATGFNKEFWKAINNFYVQYRYKKSGNGLKGNMWMMGEEKFNHKISKIQIRDDFKFLENQ